MSPFLSDCPSLMLGIAIHCIQHSLVLQNRRKFTIDYQIESAALNRLYHRLLLLNFFKSYVLSSIYILCTLKYKTIHVYFYCVACPL